MTLSSSDKSRSWSRLALALGVTLSVGCGADTRPKPSIVSKGKDSAGVKGSAGKADGGKADAGKADGGHADGGKADGGSGDAGKPDAADDGKGTGGAADGKADGPATGGAADASPAADAESGAVAVADAESGAAGDGAAADGAAADGAAGTGGAEPAADPKALLKEVAKKRTKDDRANEALAAAETAGATPKDLARAAHKRGKALHATPDRAKVFFEYALAKDPKYADPAFSLAKQAVNKGELDAAIKHLTEVKKRKGKKLLQQIDFDPMWDVVKDDPDVRQLIEG